MKVVEENSELKSQQEIGNSAVEETKETFAPKKLSYEELGRIANELNGQVHQVTTELNKEKQKNAFLVKQLDMMSVEGTYKTLDFCFRLTESNYFNAEQKGIAVKLITDILFGQESNESK